MVFHGRLENKGSEYGVNRCLRFFNKKGFTAFWLWFFD